jgi:hypothetical protein
MAGAMKAAGRPTSAQRNGCGRFKVYQASAGTLPGTAGFEHAVELLLNDARVLELKSVKRLSRADGHYSRILQACTRKMSAARRWLNMPPTGSSNVRLIP